MPGWLAWQQLLARQTFSWLSPGPTRSGSSTGPIRIASCRRWNCLDSTQDRIWRCLQAGITSELNFLAMLQPYNQISYVQKQFFTSDRRTGSGDVLASSLSWNLSKDSALIAMTGTKEITTVADLVCKVASDRGIMEVRVVDHTLEPMHKVGNDL